MNNKLLTKKENIIFHNFSPNFNLFDKKTNSKPFNSRSFENLFEVFQSYENVFEAFQ